MHSDREGPCCAYLFAKAKDLIDKKLHIDGIYILKNKHFLNIYICMYIVVSHMGMFAKALRLDLKIGKLYKAWK